MAENSNAGDADFETVRKVRTGSFIAIGRHKIEVIEGRAKLRITAADGEHFRAGFTPPNEAQPTSTPTPNQTT